ncbi:hypothetical protein BOTBODRAFT_28718 [Botryobasidium botryosum FD-172 SS1]|uniref:Cytochrome P450 n=1 Tax=Botryobasidium botryosum (strain FD-172 SS1) TaxID=930990 RepID=A0A067MRU8_BOTB1|nr:hypothetical protein BOTBODRAFT_28718 [Botryobasidium botryosum FD-172 SS1]
MMYYAVPSLLLVSYVFSRIIKYYSGRRAVGYLRGYAPALSSGSVLGMQLPTNIEAPYIWNPGLGISWDGRHGSLYKDSDMYSLVPWISGPPQVFVASFETMEQVSAHGFGFDKRVFNPGETMFGENIATTQKDSWKKHRRVFTPGFSNKTYAHLWESTIEIFKDMMATEGWDRKKEVFIPIVNRVTTKFAMSTLCSCAFGFPHPWSKPPMVGNGEMSLLECIIILKRTLAYHILVPRWAYYLPIPFLGMIENAYKLMTEYLQSLIAIRRQQLKDAKSGDEAPADVFSAIVQAHEGDEKSRMTEKQILSDAFVLLFAGHATTAHTICSTIGLLAYYQDEQDKAYDEITSVLAGGRLPVFDDLESFMHLHYCFMEANRLFPVFPVVLREAVEDTRLTTPSRTPGKPDEEIYVRKGTEIAIDYAAIYYNPRYYPDPEAFKPSRFDPAVTPTPVQFIGMGVGPRACMGRKFAFTEAVCFLVMLLRDWKIDVALERGETREEWKKRALTASVNGMLTMAPLPVRLIRRE